MQQQYNMGHLASKRNGGSDLSLNTTRRGQTLFEVLFKVEKILEDSLDLILSPSPSLKIQIMGGKVCLRCKGKTLLGVVNKLLKTKSLLSHIFK